MKPAHIFIVILLLYGSLYSQNLLRSPESIVYDSLYKRYLISNWANGSIVQVDSNGNQSYFTTGHSSINGITICKRIVFAGCSTRVKAFRLEDAQPVMNLLIPGALNINDVEADDSGNIYLSDFDAKKIMKVNIETQIFTTFVSGLAQSPNGILFDKDKNRLLICTFGYNISVLAVNLEDSSVSIAANTSLSDCDGFAKDKNGNYYISSWATRAIHKFSSDFSSTSMIYKDSGGPADISYDSIHDVLAVPLMMTNSFKLIQLNSTPVKEDNEPPHSIKLNQNYPNPFNSSTVIGYSLKDEGQVKLLVYDIKGELLSTLVNEKQIAGAYKVNLTLPGNVSTGVYIYKVTVTANSSKKILSEVKKMVYLK